VLIKSLDELRQADDRTLNFTPLGLGRMQADDAAQYQQEVVAQFELVPDVADGTKKSFDRLRTVYAYGVLCYDLYTLVNDHALLVFEQALRDRFIEYHGGVLKFRAPSGAIEAVEAERYDQVHEYVAGHRKSQLCLPGEASMFFNATLGGLRDWARRVGLLRGQRNRGLEGTLSTLRNFVAHPSGYNLHGPLDAARTLSDLHEIINQLWGQATPGGRLYPEPLARQIIMVAWNATESCLQFRADQLGSTHDLIDDEWHCILLRAVYQPGALDWGLERFDAQFETTQYPADLLWGPGSIRGAYEWYTTHQPAPDAIDYLDRLFVFRLAEDQLYLPMRPATATQLPPDERAGRWYAIRADYPSDALNHARNLTTGPAHYSSDGEWCPACRVETVASGDYIEVLVALGLSPAATSSDPPTVRLPWSYQHPLRP
jgi:hypothetical protein